MSCTKHKKTQDQTDVTSEIAKSNTFKKWWKEGVLYQIYPQSFNDTDGDGFGDFRGVIEKLDYLERLGITMVWMNPFFESPLVDNGYDVSNYKAIHPRYGRFSGNDGWYAGPWHQVCTRCCGKPQ